MADRTSVEPVGFRSYPDRMGHDTSRGQDVREQLADLGIVVTDEGVDRARRRLREAEARRDPTAWAAMRERLGLPSRPT